MTWKHISVYQFQRIEQINDRKDYDDVSKACFTACVAFGLTEHELSSMDPKRATRLVKKVGQVFAKSIPIEWYRTVGLYKIQYDVEQLTFGQYVELAVFFLNKTQNLHKIMATVSKGPQKEHSDRADYFGNRSILVSIGCVERIKSHFERFNEDYKDVFGLDATIHGKEASGHPFHKHFGWFYSGEALADYLRIPTDEVFDLPVRRALNGLRYIKEKQKYEHWLYKQNQKT